MIAAILKWVSSGALDRVLDTVDRRIDAETDREAVKGRIIQEAYRNRADWMNAGGFTLMLVFALPLAVWFARSGFTRSSGALPALIRRIGPLPHCLRPSMNGQALSSSAFSASWASLGCANKRFHLT